VEEIVDEKVKLTNIVSKYVKNQATENEKEYNFLNRGSD
jgi:hypothetical protein